jgi:hypothetical protein
MMAGGAKSLSWRPRQPFEGDVGGFEITVDGTTPLSAMVYGITYRDLLISEDLPI